jgi:hypothetical protein
LARLRQSVADLLPQTGGWAERLFKALDGLEQEIAKTPKSVAWRARSVVGERMPWYERPEEPDVG